ncbi:Non-repetitive/WGA-negative nucleoporin C-terminal domain containing protein [Hyaloscypha variabilis]
MFSPSQNGTAPPASVRTSRRRQRPLSNEGSIVEPKRKRQRSALNEQTFIPPDGAPEMEEAKSHRTAALVRNESVREIPGSHREMVVRGKKSRSTDRSNKGDGSVVLTTNDTYTVSKLPAFPDLLRANVTDHQHGAIYSDSGYALTLTHTHAIVWPYAVNIPSPETFSFELPHPSKPATSPLPLGTLVSASASSSEPGLVVVIPSSGKVTYWETISSAATLDLRLQRNGVDTTIQGMLSGETVTQILNAESAGFVLSFSTGRVAYMSVRDGQGRPAISTQFLRGSTGSVSGGIFGSLRNALSSSVGRGDIAAVRAGPQAKVGERNVVVATVKGKVQSWKMHRGGHTSLDAEAEGREAIVMAIKGAIPAMTDLHLESFEILDFTYTPKPVADVQNVDQDDGDAHILLLTSLSERHSSHYFLVEIVLRRDEMSIGNIRAIKSYTTQINRTATSKPRIYLPNPALVAYVVFDRAIVVLSMAKQPDSPDLQLRAESHILPQSFEDVIDFREDLNVEIVGSGMEEPHGPSHGIEDAKSRRQRTKHPAVVLIVRGGGVVRVAATDITKLASSKAQQVTAKSKLEQAVFFGTMDRNPLSFAGRPELQFSSEEVADAALELSLDILKSDTPHIPSVPASINQNLEKRSAALQHLAEHMKASGVVLDRVTRWRLLWNAEKMRAAVEIWKRYDACVREKAAGQKRGLLAEVVDFIHEDYKTQPVPEAGELDRVRHWFIKDVWNLEIAIPWAYQVIKYTYQDGQKDHNYVMHIMSEADDLVLAALQGAFDFRIANLELYGLADEELEHGILKTNYKSLPEFWTSTFYVAENLRKQTQLAGALVKEYWGKEHQEGQPSHIVVDKVRLDYSALIDIFIRSNTERVRWDLAQESHQNKIEGEQLEATQHAAQEEELSILATNLDLADDAIELAEKHEILPTLAEVLQYEVEFSRSKAAEPGLSEEERPLWRNRTEILRHRLRTCFVKFGTKWANALFEYEVSLGSMEDLLNGLPEEQEYLTAFLRSRPEYAKVAWINEVTREKNFDQASEALLDLGLKRETDLWSKKIELSMGKLALLAGRNYSQANGVIIPDGGETELSSVHEQLALIKIQDQIYDVVLPSIANAIDENAELQLALESHVNNILKDQPTLTSFLEENMARLVKHEAMDAMALIDLLTLMGTNDDFRSAQFYLALQATCYGLNRDDQVLMQRIIWRRCMLRDNWSDVNNTEHKDDQQVSEQLSKTALYQTFYACLSNRLFDEKSPVRPVSPEDVLGAGTEDLARRFTGLEVSTREKIIKDMQAEDALLAPYIESSRLDKWYQTALAQAKQDYAEEMNDENDDGRKMKEAEEALDQVERVIKESERKKAESLLHSTPRHKAKTNGHLGGFRRSIKQY